MFNRILVPTDFSPASDAALVYAHILAAQFGASLQLLHVVDDPGASSDFVADGAAPAAGGVREELLTHARERLAHVLGVADRGHFHTSADAVLGMAAPAIVDYARATAASLIVMGTHGRTGLAHLIMGSVAEHVVRTAPCPVLTVRQAGVVDEAGVPVLNYRLQMQA